MKKILLIALLLFTMSLISCGYKEYSGNYANLYSVAVNSLLWINGYSWESDFKCDPQIEIIEKDSFGRILFTYHEKYYKGSDIAFSSLIVCQNSNDNEVYYYEDINYIIKEQVIYSNNIEKFTDDEIAYLKLINDWNEEINYEKCVRKAIINSKPKIPNENELKKEIVDEFELDKGKYVLFMDFLTTNLDNTMYIIYGYIRKNEQEKINFIGLIVNDDFLNLSIIVPSNLYDCIPEFIEFKKLNDWY